MKTRLRKKSPEQNSAPATSIQAQFQSRSLFQTSDSASIAGNTPVLPTLQQQPEGQEKQGFNFAEIPIFSGGTQGLTPRVQPKFFQGDRAGNIAQQPVQRQEGEDEEPAQAKGESDQKVKATQLQINLAPSGGGKAMPEPVQQKMETAFGTDFSGVRIHEGPQAKAINAIAYTQGENIHFQPGKYQPDTQSGQELLGHELTHVVQQQAGKVAAPQRKGIPINTETNLETEADLLGAKAARGERVQVAGVSSSHQPMKQKENDTTTDSQQINSSPSKYSALKDKFQKKPQCYIKSNANFCLIENNIIKEERLFFSDRQAEPVEPIIDKKWKNVDGYIVQLINSKNSDPKFWVPLEHLELPGGGSEQTRLPSSKNTTIGGGTEPNKTPGSNNKLKPGDAPGKTEPPKIEDRRKSAAKPDDIKSGDAPGKTEPPKTEERRKSAAKPDDIKSGGTTGEPAASTQTNQPTSGGETPIAEAKAPEIDPWKSAAKLDDPALEKEHQGEKWYIKANRKFSQVEADGSIGFPTTYFPEGTATKVDLVDNVTRSVQFLPAGAQFFDPESGKPYTGPTTDTNVKKIKELKRNEVEGLVIKLQEIGGEYWVPNSSLKTKSVNGYLVDSSGTKYWVPEENIEKSAAGFVQADQNAPLFPKEGPKPEHILQGALGDCYLMAAFASITSANPNYPKEMMRDNGDGTVTVRLYKVKKSNATEFEATEEYLKIDKSVPQDGGRDLYAQKYLWVQMLEKAYAASGQRKDVLTTGKTDNKEQKGSYGYIASGSSNFAFEVLLGKKASYTDLKTDLKAEADQNQESKKILTQIAQALKEGKAVAAGTRQLTTAEQEEGNSEGKGHSGGEGKLGGIVATHAYTILAVNESGKKIKVRNPWGEYGRKADGTKEDKGDGIFWLPLNEFLNWFSSLFISGKVETLPAK